MLDVWFRARWAGGAGGFYCAVQGQGGTSVYWMDGSVGRVTVPGLTSAASTAVLR